MKHFGDGLQYLKIKELIMLATISGKQNILKTVQGLPDNTSIEEAMERLYLLFKVEKGCNQADLGKTVSHAEAEKRMKKWLK